MSNIAIYPNPACGTSRNTLELFRNSGAEPEIILYLETPPSREELVKPFAAMGISVRELLRVNTAPYGELGLDNPDFTDAQRIDAILLHPILMNRPVVVTPLGTALCRLSEKALDILPDAQKGAFTKEDGECVVDKDGKRLV